MHLIWNKYAMRYGRTELSHHVTPEDARAKIPGIRQSIEDVLFVYGPTNRELLQRQRDALYLHEQRAHMTDAQYRRYANHHKRIDQAMLARKQAWIDKQNAKRKISPY